MCVARHAQITLNNKFGISLQCIKKGVSDEVNFLHVDKLESLLLSSIPKVPEMASL